MELLMRPTTAIQPSIQPNYYRSFSAQISTKCSLYYPPSADFCSAAGCPFLKWCFFRTDTLLYTQKPGFFLRSPHRTAHGHYDNNHRSVGSLFVVCFVFGKIFQRTATVWQFLPRFADFFSLSQPCFGVFIFFHWMDPRNATVIVILYLQ